MTSNRPHTAYALSGGNLEIIDLTQDEVAAPVLRSAETGTADRPDDLAAGLEQIILEDDDDVVQKFETADDYEFGDEEEQEEFRELSEGEWADVAFANSTPDAYELVTVTTRSGIKLTVGMCIELVKGDFLLVKHLRHDYARGILLRRTREAEGMLPKKLNELYAILLAPTSVKDPAIDGCLVMRPLDDVIAVRQLICTNYLFPELRPMRTINGMQRYDGDEDTGTLICRWKYIQTFDNVKHKAICQPTLMRLNESECTTGHAMSCGVLRQNWRGPHLGSVQAQGIPEPFTYGDICTGAGGAARGAEQSGLQLAFFLDNWLPARRTLDANWPHVNMLHMDIFEFLTTKFPISFVVDILHISFPCQPHSLLNTRPGGGKNGDKNIAAGYSVGLILEKCKPRVVTFEQTSGIVHRGGYHYRALIGQLADCNYNVRTKIITCDAYGNAQARKRLFIIASCPGEALPPFPRETHGLAPGSKRPTTIRDRLRLLRNYDIPPHMQVCEPKLGAPHDSNLPLKHCITTDGGAGNLHPNGGRTYTLAELACVGDFPPIHQFRGCKTDIKRLIGNAVPVCVMEAILAQAQITMTGTDQAIAAASMSAIEID